MAESQIVGYRLEWKPGEYCYSSPENYEKDICKESARVHALHLQPQAGCCADVEVYKNGYWVQPKYLFKSAEGMTPMYLGRLIHEPDWVC